MWLQAGGLTGPRRWLPRPAITTLTVTSWAKEFPENPRDLFVSTVAGGASVTRLVVHDIGRIYESGNL